MQDNLLLLRSYSILAPKFYLLLIAVSEYLVPSPALIAGKCNHFLAGKPSARLCVDSLLSNWVVVSLGTLQGFILSLACSIFTTPRTVQ